MEVQSDTTNTTQTNTTFRGRVKWFNSTRGYGFITNLDKDEDTFVHHSGITPTVECWKTLTPGEYVEYSLDTDDDGKSQATSVTGIAGGPLLCETNTSRNRRGVTVMKEDPKNQRRNAVDILIVQPKKLKQPINNILLLIYFTITIIYKMNLI